MTETAVPTDASKLSDDQLFQVPPGWTRGERLLLERNAWTDRVKITRDLNALPDGPDSVDPEKETSIELNHEDADRFEAWWHFRDGPL